MWRRHVCPLYLGRFPWKSAAFCERAAVPDGFSDTGCRISLSLSLVCRNVRHLHEKKKYIYIFFLGGFFLSSLPILHDKLSKEAGTRINGYDRDSGLACGRIFLPSFFCVCVCVCVVISSFLLHFLIFFPLLWPSRLSCHRKQQTKIAPVNLYIWQSTTRNPTPPPGRTLL